MRAVRYVVVALVGLVGALSLPAFGQGTSNSTITTSFSSQLGSINAEYVWATDTIGPEVITIGARTGCTLVGSPPYAGCSLYGGSGTANDPFTFQCSSPLALTGCSGGQSLTVPAGWSNLDLWTHTVIAVAPVVTAQSVPLSPWVPLASVAGVLLVILLRRRGAMRG